MSHVITAKSVMTDPVVLNRVCDKLGLPAPRSVEGMHISGKLCSGTLVELKNWNIPLIVEKDGLLNYDNWGGRWGDPAQLEEFQETYKSEWEAQKIDVLQQEAALHGCTFRTEAIEGGGTRVHLQKVVE